jgi:hypothetical protein
MSTEFSFGANNSYEQNIRMVYGRATDSDIIAGRAWYTLAHRTAGNLTPKDLHIAAGIIAAFSPQMAWKKNVELAATCIRRNRFTGHYGANNRKARRIANGIEPLKVLGGEKTRAFYQCIESAGNCDAVCVDRHAIAVCLGRNAEESERKNVQRKKYAAYANAYRNVASEIGILPSELQAVCWVCWRREEGITD